MKNFAMVKEEYRSADFETRLYLYLDCPELREDFIKIEQEEDALMTPEIEQPDGTDRIVKMIDNLLNFIPVSLQAKIKRICCG